jgi:hypothetical protein
MTRIKERMLLAGTIAATVLVGGVGATQASALEIPCATRTLSKAFSRWGDLNDYFVVTDGTFEAGAPTWKLDKGAAVAAKLQATWKVNGAAHNFGLSIPNGSRAKAPETCLTVGEESFRFFYRTPAVKGATLTVTVTSKSDMGTVSSSIKLTGNGTSAWAVSPQVAIPNVLGEDYQQYVEISFAATGGVWAIDDVMVDPFKPR